MISCLLVKCLYRWSFQELEELHLGQINAYRTHLLSAVQGHMDPDVKEALHSIIEMRSMEQFC